MDERVVDDLSGRPPQADDSPPAEEARPAAPLPPPQGWGEHWSGPGSPAGSVRPPDTTATADAGRSRPPAFRGLTAGVVGGLVGAVVGVGATLAVLDVPSGPADPVTAPVVQSDGEAAGTVTAVAEAVIPSVVRVDRLEFAGGLSQPSGLGSGVIYRSDGYILTNNHVVEGADRLQVKFANGESADARMVGSDPLTDIAVLKVDRGGLPAINVREDAVQVGELAVAIGAPFGLNGSVTAGVVSAVNRSLDLPVGDGFVSVPNVIQTDAAINPGNSGGALVDASARLIGINTAIKANPTLAGQPGNVGVGFAISAQDAVAIADRLIEQGFVRHARLGIEGGDLTPSLAREFGIDVEQGVLVRDVEPGGPAAEAGIRAGDVIVAAAGEPVEGMDGLVRVIRAHEPGDRLALDVVREGGRVEIAAVLGEWRR